MQTLSYRQSLKELKDKRFLAVLLFGFIQGFPWVLHGTILTLWLQESGFSRSTIGFISAIATVYAINWTWAPFVDRLRLPLLYPRFGQRRSWIILCQCLIALCIGLISLTSPSENLLAVSLLAFMIAVLSATQDISIDAYRINIFAKEEMDAKMPYAAAMNTAGFYAGWTFIGGATALALGGESIGMSWPMVYRSMIGIYLILVLLALLTPKPESEVLTAGQDGSDRIHSVSEWFVNFVVNPFREFFQRCGMQLAVSILLLLVVFRLGEAMLGRMSLVFYVEVGFTRDQIGFYQQFFGGLMTVVYSILGAMINTHYGVIRGLFVAGIAMAGANLLFAVIAIVGPNVNLLMLTLLIDNFFQAFAAVAFISFISYFTSRTYTGTQYALMASISNFGRTTLAAGSGFVIDFLNGDWVIFFVLTTLMVVPGLCLLLWVGKLMESYSESTATQISS
ncbi:MAG: MFS transporter [Pseudomonadales bacterium]|nr:MFS transporter [Pseudomonadales bacterium]